jgi:hypothetical protein
MKERMYLIIIAVLGLFTGFAQAANTGDMALENTILKQRLDLLDKEIQSLKQNALMTGNKDSSISQKPVWSSIDVQLYGYLKFDAAYDDSRIDSGNYAKWVDSESTNNNDDQFSMTANETRLGMLLSGPKNGGLVTSGKVEIDFYGTGAAENKAGIMMRHAYIKMDWPQDKFSILAGQTSDVISPLVPTTLNYTVCWWAGNIGYRRPQLRLTKEYNLAEKVDMKLEGALSRTIGRNDTMVDPATETGEDAGFPTLQGRISVTMPVYGEKLTTIGLSGHKGQEEYDLNAAGDSKDFESWSINLDLTQPVCDKLLVRGELFSGKDLDSYLGGIGQGIVTTGAHILTPVRSSGGWVEATLGPWDGTEFNLGYSMDDVHEGNVNTGDKTQNRAVFGNVIYALNKQTDVGLELSHWFTEYKDSKNSESVRLQAALKYKF